MAAGGARNWNDWASETAFFLCCVREPKERLPPLGFWPHALARVATLPAVIFEVLRFKPNLVPSEEAEGKEAAKHTGVARKRQRGQRVSRSLCQLGRASRVYHETSP
jgi:hypothetical protein